VGELTAWSKDLTVEVAGRDVINHAGAAALRLIADRSGLAGGLSRALARPGFVPVHDRGRVLADAAVLIADGGRVLSDLATLRDQGELYGPVASDPTLWRALDEIGESQRRKIARVRAKTRQHMWSLIEKRHGAIPPSRVAEGDLGKTIVIRLDASIVIAHSDKELAAGTFKGTWGHHPLMAWCDNTGESLALRLRKGSAGSNTTTDHIEVLDEAISQIPARYRRDLLITVDGAGASHGLVNHITTLNSRPGYRVHYSIGWELGERERAALNQVPHTAVDAVLDIDGQPRSLAEAGVVELTALLREHPDGDPVGELASRPADHRPPGETAPRRPAVPVRTGRGVALPAPGHQHPRQDRAVPRGPPSTARPGRGQHPHRQANRPGSSHLHLDRDQPGLVPGRHHRLRPAVLATPALPGRTPRQGRTQDPALPAAAHRRPHRPRPTQTQNPYPRHLALGPATGHLPTHRARPAPTDPMLINHALSPTQETIRNRGIRRPLDATTGPPTLTAP
jgi:Transposase DDE domain group 1